MAAQHGAQRTYALLTLANKLVSQCEVQVGIRWQLLCERTLFVSAPLLCVCPGRGSQHCLVALWQLQDFPPLCPPELKACYTTLPATHSACNPPTHPPTHCPQVTRLHAFAFPLAEVAVAVAASNPDFVPLLAARLHQVCACSRVGRVRLVWPLTVPKPAVFSPAAPCWLTTHCSCSPPCSGVPPLRAQVCDLPTRRGRRHVPEAAGLQNQGR